MIFDDLKDTAMASPFNDTFGTVGGVFGAVINTMLGIGIGISIVAIGLSGIKFITSKGDIKAKQAAQQALTYSVVAFLLTLGALSAKLIAATLFGVTAGDILNETPNF